MVPPLITTEWLAANLSNVVVLDGTWHMPRLGRNARSEFLQRRIPGARFFDIEDVSDHETNLPHMLPPKEQFEAAMGALGVSPDSHVVVYDTYGMMSGPRVWWTLTEFGHAKVSVLDGGLPKWVAEGRPVESGEPDIKPTTYKATPASSPSALTFEQVSSTYTLPPAEQILIDGRPAGRFHGTVAEPRPFLPSGHIPGSVSVPALELLKDGTVLPDSELRARFQSSGVSFDGSQTIVNTCGSGVAASATFLLLTHLGVPRDRLKLYDGSWTEWIWRGGPTEAEGPVNEVVTTEAKEKGLYMGGPGSGS